MSASPSHKKKEQEDGIAVLIPAIKKSVAFPDDLVKKLAGIPLIQRAIDNASRAFSLPQVHVVTDSEEIGLICRRNDVACFYDRELRLNPEGHLESLRPCIQQLAERWRDILVLSPYVPLIGDGELRDAYRHYLDRGAELLVPVGRIFFRPYSPWSRPLERIFRDDLGQEIAIESRAFSIMRSSLFREPLDHPVEPVPYALNGRLIEIRDYENWWLCEKLLNRRRIVFRVIGHKEVGMGHIYRCLALAHEIADHEIRFVCDRRSQVAANTLAGYDYWLGVYEPEEIEAAILHLKPDLVVNDVLDTDAGYVCRMKECGSRVVNFEDLGSGARHADLTINDLFDEPRIEGESILWGHEWFFVRDEFTDATPHRFSEQVSRLLIAFGGTDPNDLTRKILRIVAPYCRETGIAIDVVTGEGYGHIKELEEEVASFDNAEISYTYATGVISHIMEGTQIAICSNGRTVYELAHMNIPSIVLAHHERERTHRFACEENGFIPLGIYSGKDSDENVLKALRHLVEDSKYRQKLFLRMPRANFTSNKRKVVERILDLLKRATT